MKAGTVTPRRRNVVSSKGNVARLIGNSRRAVPALNVQMGLDANTNSRPRHDSLLKRRTIVIGAAAALVCASAIVRVSTLMPVRRLPLPFGRRRAGYCERLFFHALDNNLKAGRMSTVYNGKIVAEADAERIVTRARACGWLPPYISIYQNERGE
jgi:hypothetical protein